MTKVFTTLLKEIHWTRSCRHTPANDEQKEGLLFSFTMRLMSDLVYGLSRQDEKVKKFLLADKKKG